MEEGRRDRGRKENTAKCQGIHLNVKVRWKEIQVIASNAHSVVGVTMTLEMGVTMTQKWE